MSQTSFRETAEGHKLKNLSFGVDYTANGEDRHKAYQILGDQNKTLLTAMALYEELMSKGWIPQAICYYPGDFTMDELEAILDENPPKHEAKPMFLSGALAKHVPTPARSANLFAQNNEAMASTGCGSCGKTLMLPLDDFIAEVKGRRSWVCEDCTRARRQEHQ